MAKDPAFLFYDGDAARDVSHMNRLERGCYFDIIQAQKKFGRLSIGQIMKVLGSDFDECWAAIELVLKEHDSKFYIEWLEESIMKRVQFSESRRKNRRSDKHMNDISDTSLNISNTSVPHMENENAIENVNVVVIKEKKESGENYDADFRDYEAWTDGVIMGNDEVFNVMIVNERLQVNGSLEKFARDHLGLLAEYPNKRPTSQHRWRLSLLKHIREQLASAGKGKTSSEDARQKLKRI